MFKFFSKRDEGLYKHHLDLRDWTFKNTKTPYRASNVEHWVEVGEFKDCKAFKFRRCLEWIGFEGSWDELKERLTTDFPEVFPENLEFYTVFVPPGILIK